MPEAITKAGSTTKSRTGKETAASSASFQFPQFEMPKVEIPDAARAVAVNWVSQARENFERMVVATEGLNGVLNRTCSTAAKGAADYGAKVTEAMHADTAAAFDFAHDLFAAKSVPEMIEISTASARKQLDLLTSQNQELWAFAQQIIAETLKPITGDISKIFNTTAST